jgi:hypothetical protein
MLDPMRGIGGELADLIDGGYYFVIHAARQSGKTTLLKALSRQINAGGDYYALYCSLETVGVFPEPEKGIPAVVKTIEAALSDNDMPDGFAAKADYADVANVLRKSLIAYCRGLSKPLVIFFDEADCLAEGTVITFLRQLRNGYIDKPDVPFPHSVSLIGMRNIRDYKARIRDASATLGSASPFNIMKDSLNLRNFTAAETAELYAQHTAETGHVFEPQAIEFAFEQTRGQPWLVNAIACECVEKITKKDYSIPIDRPLVEQAIQNLILTRGTHFDSLMERLKEPRVRGVIQPLITGDGFVTKSSDDYLYTRDLGLICERGGETVPANPIYTEIIVRLLNSDAQDTIRNEFPDREAPLYLKGGRLDMDALITGFQQYWRENSEIWADRYKTELYQYNEAAAHLVLLAYLQRVINGGGQILREMALGRMRADICVVYDGQKYPLELKILQNQKSLEQSLKQTAAYMDKVGATEGWLVLFDRDTAKSWDEKIYMRKEAVDNKTVTVVGC